MAEIDEAGVLCMNCGKEFNSYNPKKYFGSKLENHPNLTLYEAFSKVVSWLKPRTRIKQLKPKKGNEDVWWCRSCARCLGNFYCAYEALLTDGSPRPNSYVDQIIKGRHLEEEPPSKSTFRDSCTQTDACESSVSRLEICDGKKATETCARTNTCTSSSPANPGNPVQDTSLSIHNNPLQAHVDAAMKNPKERRKLRAILRKILVRDSKKFLKNLSTKTETTSPEEEPNWELVFKDLRKHAPFVFTALFAISLTPSNICSPKVGTALFILMNSGSPKCNRFQKYINCLLLGAHADTRVFTPLTHFGITIPYSTKCTNLKKMVTNKGPIVTTLAEEMAETEDVQDESEPPAKKLKIITITRSVKPQTLEEDDDQQAAQCDARQRRSCHGKERIRKGTGYQRPPLEDDLKLKLLIRAAEDAENDTVLACAKKIATASPAEKNSGQRTNKTGKDKAKVARNDTTGQGSKTARTAVANSGSAKEIPKTAPKSLEQADKSESDPQSSSKKQITRKKPGCSIKSLLSKMMNTELPAKTATTKNGKATSTPKKTNMRTLANFKRISESNSHLEEAIASVASFKETPAKIINPSPPSSFRVIQSQASVPQIRPVQTVTFNPGVIGIMPSQIFIKNIPIYIGIPVGQPAVQLPSSTAGETDGKSTNAKGTNVQLEVKPDVKKNQETPSSQ